MDEFSRKSMVYRINAHNRFMKEGPLSLGNDEGKLPCVRLSSNNMRLLSTYSIKHFPCDSSLSNTNILRKLILHIYLRRQRQLGFKTNVCCMKAILLRTIFCDNRKPLTMQCG